MKKTLALGSLVLASILCPTAAFSSDGVASQLKSSELSSMNGLLADGDRFGFSITSIGDIDGNGVEDLAIGSDFGGAGDPGAGSVWVQLMGLSGDPISSIEITEGRGGFDGDLDPGDRFGVGVTRIADLDGDGISEVIVGASYDDDGGDRTGALWVLFLDTSGMVRATRKISATTNDLPAGTLKAGDELGESVTPIMDFDGDGTPDFAAAAIRDSDAGPSHGAVHLLSLNPDGSVKAHQEISELAGGFSGALADDDRLGSGLTLLPSLDADSVPELAVGAAGDDTGGTDRGAIWILFLRADGTVKSEVKIDSTNPVFAGGLLDNDRLGQSLCTLSDSNSNGIDELCCGVLSDQGGVDAGGIWLIELAPGGAPATARLIAPTPGGFSGSIDPGEAFGLEVSAWREDGTGLLVGAPFDSDGGPNRGAYWLLNLDSWAAVDCNSNGVLDQTDILTGFSPDLDLNGIPDECEGPSLLASPVVIPLSSGGTQTLQLQPGPEFAGQLYIVLGTTVGWASPGFPAGNGISLPLNILSPYFNYTLNNPNSPPLLESLGIVPPSGALSISLSIPAGLDPALGGLELHHAFIVHDFSRVVLASNPVPLELLP